jgi:sulfur-oxidizing protein SoxX
MRIALSALIGFCLLTASFSSTSTPLDTNQEQLVSQGKKIAFSSRKGNCIACHAIKGGRRPGNIGPPLINMKERYSDIARLRSQVWDSTRRNPNSIMPPFGRHEILTESEIDKVVAFIHTL